MNGGWWTSLRLVTRIAWEQGRGHAVAALLEVVSRVLTALFPLFAGLVVGGLAARDLTLVLLGAGGLVLSRALNFLLVIVGVESRLVLMERVGHAIDLRVGQLSGEAATLDHLEDPAHQDQAQALAERLGRVGMAYNLLVNVLNNLAGPVITIVVAATADWRLLLLLAVALPATWLGRRSIQWEAEAEKAGAEAGRRSAHLLGAATAPVASSELRVLGARRWALDLLSREAARWRHPHRTAEVRTAGWSIVLAVGYLGAAAAILAWMVRDALDGRIDPGRLVTGVLVVGQLRESVTDLQWVISGLSGALRAVSRYRWLEDYARTVDEEHAGTAAPPARLTDGIRLQGVGFRYPGADRESLSDIDLHLPAGAVVAVVGENGAGKSTLVKLLTGMHDLSSGRILVDGVDLRALDLPAWRARCSGAFQDHARLELTAREAVGAGSVEVLDAGRAEIDSRVLRALEDSSASDVLRALPDGLDTQLGAAWPGGVDISGGQWQRLAVARAMVRLDPLLLVLDEPTSALDPATEHALFDRYAEAARATGGRGGVTLLITHRFSTVAAADLVIVLADGGVAEVGTHADLMAAGGRYADLYALQAAGYR
ncbi:ATP-binding cassette subfamily B protein [Barrientosiimonas humi]|uniref:ATP-binding cassette subfamily B protein n=1 Tax=Barrientosiimonas humi TaxID=999931 RepID=A0A542XF72_9MICO|nr:ABC transporter ATP-binding protein [Barrientosiimonas humi]TQL34456.1 ATP-binding cassette subfamily B protein [Barrientosiimonas humi]CAG7574445.1 Lipid A export ATP-binding/permease protein MsbA [Barrientosiimonas humi]